MPVQKKSGPEFSEDQVQFSLNFLAILLCDRGQSSGKFENGWPQMENVRSWIGSLVGVWFLFKLRCLYVFISKVTASKQSNFCASSGRDDVINFWREGQEEADMELHGHEMAVTALSIQESQSKWDLVGSSCKKNLTVVQILRKIYEPSDEKRGVSSFWDIRDQRLNFRWKTATPRVRILCINLKLQNDLQQKKL